jgi:hypothetical protein
MLTHSGQPIVLPNIWIVNNLLNELILNVYSLSLSLVSLVVEELDYVVVELTWLWGLVRLNDHFVDLCLPVYMVNGSRAIVILVFLENRLHGVRVLIQRL